MVLFAHVFFPFIFPLAHKRLMGGKDQGLGEPLSLSIVEKEMLSFYFPEVLGIKTTAL